MVNRPRDFRHHDVVRAFRAARAAGVEHPSIEIHLPGGTRYVLGGAVEAPKPKLSKGRDGDFAERGGSNRMAGKGDRTKTAPEDAAGKQQAGGTAHKTSEVAGSLLRVEKGSARSVVHRGQLRAGSAPPRGRSEEWRVI